jgi:hypothetical protein
MGRESGRFVVGRIRRRRRIGIERVRADIVPRRRASVRCLRGEIGMIEIPIGPSIIVPAGVKDDAIGVALWHTIGRNGLSIAEITAVDQNRIVDEPVDIERRKRLSVRFGVGRGIDVSSAVASTAESGDPIAIRFERCRRRGTNGRVSRVRLHPVGDRL